MQLHGLSDHGLNGAYTWPIAMSTNLWVTQIIDEITFIKLGSIFEWVKPGGM